MFWHDLTIHMSSFLLFYFYTSSVLGLGYIPIYLYISSTLCQYSPSNELSLTGATKTQQEIVLFTVITINKTYEWTIR